MEINQIIYLLKAIEMRSFSKAADQLFVSQPALSQQIAKLEQELSVTLIDRTTRTFTPTKAGEAFCRYATEVIGDIRKLYSEMEKYKTDEKRTLKIGIFPTLSKLGMTKTIFQFTGENPNVKIELVESFSEHLYSLVVGQKIDLAIVNKIDYPIHDRSLKLAIYPIIYDRIVLLTNSDHPLANEKSVTLAQALEYPVVKLSNHTSVTLTMNSVYNRLNLKPQIACECTTTSNMISLVDEGYGVSFLSRTVAENYITNKTRMVKIVPKINSTSAIITLKRNVSSNSLTYRFIEHMLKHIF